MTTNELALKGTLEIFMSENIELKEVIATQKEEIRYQKSQVSKMEKQFEKAVDEGLAAKERIRELQVVQGQIASESNNWHSLYDELKEMVDKGKIPNIMVTNLSEENERQRKQINQLEKEVERMQNEIDHLKTPF